MKNYILLLVILGIMIAGCTTKNNVVLPPPKAETSVVTPTETTKAGNELGQQAFIEANYPEAVRYYTEWLGQNPDDSQALLYRGRSYLQMQQHEAALKDLAKTQDIIGRVYQAKALINMNRSNEAQKVLTALFAHDDFNRLSQYEAFWAYYMDGQVKNTAGQAKAAAGQPSQAIFEESLQSLDNAIASYEANPSIFGDYNAPYAVRFAYYQKSVANHFLGKQALAGADMEQYIELSGKANVEVDSKDYKSVVLAYYLANKIDKCKPYIEKLSDEDRQDLYEKFSDRLFQ